MNAGRIIIAALVAGVVMNFIDYVSFTYLFPGYMQMPFMNPTPPIPWLVLCDFIYALVFTVVFDRVRTSFGTGPKNGSTYGFYAGVLMNFPTWIFMHLIVKDWPYAYSWFSTIYGIVGAMIIGAVVGAMYGRGQTATA